MNINFFKNNKVYIISGKFKGKKISFKNIPTLRPTTNRIRETLFNWLSKYIQNAKCLDLFSGSGALGIESISRHAHSVTALEIEKKTILCLKKNIKQLNIKNFKIIEINAISWLKKTGTPYDIIFIDPPYSQALIKNTIKLLEKNQWLKNNSIIYIETQKNTHVITPKNWELYKKKITHYIACYLYIIKIKK